MQHQHTHTRFGVKKEWIENRNEKMKIIEIIKQLSLTEAINAGTQDKHTN